MKIRPKVRVRYVAHLRDVCPKLKSWHTTAYCDSHGRAKRIAAALNLAEAVRRGEVKVSK